MGAGRTFLRIVFAAALLYALLRLPLVDVSTGINGGGYSSSSGFSLGYPEVASLLFINYQTDSITSSMQVFSGGIHGILVEAAEDSDVLGTVSHEISVGLVLGMALYSLPLLGAIFGVFSRWGFAMSLLGSGLIMFQLVDLGVLTTVEVGNEVLGASAGATFNPIGVGAVLVIPLLGFLLGGSKKDAKTKKS